MITKDMLNVLFKPWNQDSIEEDHITTNDIKNVELKKVTENNSEHSISSHMNIQEKSTSTQSPNSTMHLRRQHTTNHTSNASQSSTNELPGSRKSFNNNNHNNNNSRNSNYSNNNVNNNNNREQNSKTSSYHHYNNHYHSKGSNHHNSNSNSSGGHSRRVAHPNLTEKARGSISRDKIDKLYKLLNSQYEITSKDGTISFTISMFDYLKRLRKKLYERKVNIISMRLVGSGATYVVSDDLNQDINDLDFSMYICDSYRFLDILEVEEDVLSDLLQLSIPDSNYTRREIYDLFFLDSVKIDSSSSGIRESWSLITIGKKSSQTIDIKFVNKSKRSYVFSSDSFEVVLDPFFPYNSNYNNNNNNSNSNSNTDSIPQSIHKITVESIFGDYSQALEHMNNNILCTNNPEEIRRGIFRYSYELSKGKKPKDNKESETLDSIFTAALLSEENIPFEDVLVKFLQKHPGNASLFLTELQNVLLRGSVANTVKDNNDHVEKYLSIIEKHKQLFPTSSNKV